MNISCCRWRPTVLTISGVDASFNGRLRRKNSNTAINISTHSMDFYFSIWVIPQASGGGGNLMMAAGAQLSGLYALQVRRTARLNKSTTLPARAGTTGKIPRYCPDDKNREETLIEIILSGTLKPSEEGPKYQRSRTLPPATSCSPHHPGGITTTTLPRQIRHAPRAEARSCTERSTRSPSTGLPKSGVRSNAPLQGQRAIASRQTVQQIHIAGGRQAADPPGKPAQESSDQKESNCPPTMSGIRQL